MTTHQSLTIATHGASEIVITREFDAPREHVFDALIRPELLQRWMLGPEGFTMPVCESDPRPGGAIRIVWRKADGQDMGMSGKYRELVRPERIVRTELFDVDWTGGETVVTNRLEDLGGRTRLSMTIHYASTETRDAVLDSGAMQGVATSYDRLDELLPTLAG